MLPLPDRQTGKACEPSKSNVWRNREALDKTAYYMAIVSLQWKQCLQTYRLQTRTGPVSLTYSTRRECRSVRPDSHCHRGPSYSTTTSPTSLFPLTHSDKPRSDNITFVVTKLQTRLSQDYKWRTLPDAHGPTRVCKWSSDFVFFLFYSLIYPFVPDQSMALWDHAERCRLSNYLYLQHANTTLSNNVSSHCLQSFQFNIHRSVHR